MPRPNLYQSLHTSVITEEGTSFEIQIRTEEMHRMAEEGIAAHWKYKDGPVSVEDEQRLAWLRQVVEWQRDVSDPNEFLSTLKIDLYPKRFTPSPPRAKSWSCRAIPRPSTSPTPFTPKSDTLASAPKSTAAWCLCATNCTAATSSKSSLSPAHKPSRDWFSVVRSSRARNKIKHWLNVHQRERAIEIGKKLIDKEARKYRISLKDIKDADFQRIASDYGLGQPDDLMAGIGYGKYSARQVLGKLTPAAEPTAAAPAEEDTGIRQRSPSRLWRRHSNAIRVKGQGDMLVYRARCCNPIRGEVSRRLRHSRQRRRRALGELPQRDQSDVRTRAPHRR